MKVGWKFPGTASIAKSLIFGHLQLAMSSGYVHQDKIFLKSQTLFVNDYV